MRPYSLAIAEGLTYSFTVHESPLGFHPLSDAGQCHDVSAWRRRCYAEALEVAQHMGWTATASWTGRSRCETTQSSSRLLDLLEPCLVHPGDWKARVRQIESAP